MYPQLKFPLAIQLRGIATVTPAAILHKEKCAGVEGNKDVN